MHVMPVNLHEIIIVLHTPLIAWEREDQNLFVKNVTKERKNLKMNDCAVEKNEYDLLT